MGHQSFQAGGGGKGGGIEELLDHFFTAETLRRRVFWVSIGFRAGPSSPGWRAEGAEGTRRAESSRKWVTSRFRPEVEARVAGSRNCWIIFSPPRRRDAEFFGHRSAFELAPLPRVGAQRGPRE